MGTDLAGHQQSSRSPSESSERSAIEVAFLGPAGTFCEQVLIATPELARCVPRPRSTISEAIRCVRSGATALAFVPIENSIAGLVEETIGALAAAPELEIVLETTAAIHLGLLAIPGASFDSVRRVFSHPAAIRECRRFLSERLRGAEIEETESTAAAARRVCEFGSIEAAAIGSEASAERYGLRVLARSIEDRPDNRTRFVALGARSARVGAALNSRVPESS